MKLLNFAQYVTTLTLSIVSPGLCFVPPVSLSRNTTGYVIVNQWFSTCGL